MQKVLDKNDIELEEYCDHRRTKSDWMDGEEAYHTLSDCPHCLGTYYRVTPFGMEVLKFLSRHQSKYRLRDDGYTVERLYQGKWVTEIPDE